MSRHLFQLFISVNLIIDFLAASESCPAAGGVYAACAKKAVYLIDTSTDLTSAEIQNSFDFMRSKIIPGTAWGTPLQLAFCSYGTGLIQSQPFEDTISRACDRLSTVESAWLQLGSDTASLLTSLQVVDLFYKDADMIVLFSASKNIDDIEQAGQFVAQNMSGKIFTVIAQDKANFSKFPAQVVHEVASLAKPPSNLVSCLIKNACGQSFACNINAPADPPLYYPTTAAASTPSQAPVAPTCPCNTATVWLDVVFLFDASQATGESNLDNMWGFVASMLDFYTVQKTNYTGSDYYTQVGIVTYGNQATVEYPLGSVSGSDLDNIFSLTYNGDQQSNLEQGLKTANLQLQGSAHRANARQVIVVMTMDYNSGGADAPKKTADTIIHDGVIIMAYDYDPQHGGAPTQGLYEIASPGYYFMSDINGTVDSMNQAMCDANCFCLANYKPYSSVANLRQLPTDGCYVDTGITSNQRLAINRCATYNGGTLPTDKDAAKTTFLSQLVSDGQAFWLGLYYDNGGWKWSDNTTLLATDYQPWASGIPPDGSGSQTGAYFTGQLKWQGTDTRNLYIVVCQSSACDSTHYCPPPQ